MSTGVLSGAQEAVLDALDERALVEDLTAFVRVPSITGSAAESELQHLLARRLDDLGLETDLWPLDLAALRADPDFASVGMEAHRAEAWGLAATTPGGGTPGLILQGHVDVVPPGELDAWSGGDPWSGRLEGDLLHGRGACDMKAGVAANLATARALRDSGLRLERPLAVHCVVGEEDGGLGAFGTLRRGHRGEACVITEPTAGSILIANAGALTFRVEVTGRSAHGSMMTSGVSAVEAFVGVHAAIRRLDAERNASVDPLFSTDHPYGISIGVVRAGDWSSSVPDLLVAEGRMGVLLDEEPEAARAALERCVAAASADDPWLRDHPPRVTWPGGQFASGRLEASDPFVTEVAEAVASATGAVAPLSAAPYGSDLRLYRGLGGIRTLQYGPGDVRHAHAPTEHVSIRETIGVARSLSLLAVRRLGAHR